MVEILQILALPLSLFAGLVRRAESKVVKRLRESGALSAETATELPPLSRLGRWQLSRLETAGAVVAVPSGTYFFVPAGYQSFRRARRRRALIIVPVVLAVVLLLFWLR